jgi:uncharacterized integral membrane protein (TIGR00698 family)
MNEQIVVNRSSSTARAGSVLMRMAREGRSLLPGLVLSAALAEVSMRLGAIDWLQQHGMSALTVAIVLGILVGNTAHPRIAAHSAAGVESAKRTLLRAGVILYGFRLTLSDVAHVGLTGMVVDALVLTSTFVLARVLGMRLFRLDPATSMLIGAGSAICGAAAVMATEPVVRARAEQVTVAVSTVVVFGTLAIFVYPALYGLNLHWRLLPTGGTAFGVFAGSTIHEVAQVFAAGRSISADVANTAVITKMVRVMMLAPFLIALSTWLPRGGAREYQVLSAGTPASGSRGRVSIPWFAFAFVGVVMFNSLGVLPSGVVAVAIEVDTFLLAMAMAALGVTTHARAIRQAGVKPLLLAGLLFIWLIGGGGIINGLASAWL